jgi:hypothetical protein
MINITITVSQETLKTLISIYRLVKKVIDIDEMYWGLKKTHGIHFYIDTFAECSEDEIDALSGELK